MTTQAPTTNPLVTPVNDMPAATSPPLMTVRGILSDAGQMAMNNILPTNRYSIEESEAQYEYIRTVNISQADTANVTSFNVPFLNTDRDSVVFPPRLLALAGSTFYTVTNCSLLFLAIKPPDTTCKVHFRYRPEGDDLAPDNNAYVSEGWIWDLSQTNVFEVDVKPYCLTQAFPTRLREAWDNTGGGDIKYLNNLDGDRIVGLLYMDILQPYLGGSIYPDNFDILVFSRVSFDTAHMRLPYVHDRSPLNIQ